MLASRPAGEGSAAGSIRPSTDESRTRYPAASGATDGLTDDEARRRLRDDGPNEIASAERHGIFRTLLGVLREPMLVLLAVAAALYLVLGDPAEALILLAMVVLVVVITLVQERRTENAVEALRDLSSPRALVVRAGVRKRIAGRDVVRGDRVVVAEGDRVPADGMLIEATNLQVDESLLTGESVPVRKRMRDAEAASIANAQPGGDDQPIAYSGTLVVSGHGMLEVTATGARTAMGRIGKVLTEVGVERTPLQREVCLSGDIGAALAHRDADRRCLERRRIVHAVAGHRHHAALRGKRSQLRWCSPTTTSRPSSRRCGWAGGSSTTSERRLRT